MNDLHYVGLDVHKEAISFCARQADGTILMEGTIAAERRRVRRWTEGLL